MPRSAKSHTQSRSRNPFLCRLCVSIPNGSFRLAFYCNEAIYQKHGRIAYFDVPVSSTPTNARDTLLPTGFQQETSHFANSFSTDRPFFAYSFSAEISFLRTVCIRHFAADIPPAHHLHITCASPAYRLRITCVSPVGTKKPFCRNPLPQNGCPYKTADRFHTRAHHASTCTAPSLIACSTRLYDAA